MKMSSHGRKGRYEVDGYVYSKDEEPQLMVTGKWNTSMSYQPCDVEGEPLPGTELKEVFSSLSLKSARLISHLCCFPFWPFSHFDSFHGFAFFTVLFIMILCDSHKVRNTLILVCLFQFDCN